MSRFVHTCVLCQRSSKSAFRFAQCCECRRMICTDCAEQEQGQIKGHLKKMQEVPGAWNDFLPHFKLNKKPWTFEKLCCLDCYNSKLAAAGIIGEKMDEEK